jgi:tripartite ATP-independent transporter DctM subunit
VESAVPYLLVCLLLVLVFAGVEIAVCLGVVSFIAIFYSTGDIEISLSFLHSTAYEALRQYLFAVVPLFILMGQFIARSGAAGDLYWGLDRWLHRLPGRFAYATVLGNVVFAFVTGTSLASATTFTAIAYPQMKQAGYEPHFSLGLISGSACLGMLIPPSLLLVVWGILTDLSIGHLFLAGVIPGFILAAMMMFYIFVVSLVRPDIVGQKIRRPLSSADGTAPAANPEPVDTRPDPSFADMTISVVGLLAIMVGALGGIWVGFFTPTEGAGIGALIALLVGIAKGMRWPAIYEAVLVAGRTGIPLMIIVFAAQLYSRTLSMSGIGATLQNTIIGSGMADWGTVLFMIGVWLVMGTLIDSISIMLLTVPIFAPVAIQLGMDPLVFAIVGILTIEAGLLTPPFGLIVYAVRSVIPAEDVSMKAIFAGSAPFCIILLITIAIVLFAPATVTFLTKYI